MRRDMNTPLQQAPLVTNGRRRGRRGAVSGKPRSLPIAEWPAADRLGWAEACQPAQRLKRGGAASHLATVSQDDIANRYGLYLDFLQRNGRFDPAKDAMTLVTPDNVNGFHWRTAGPGPLRHRLELGLQAAPRRAVDRARRRLRMADRDREGYRAGHGTPVKGRPARPDRASGRSRSHLDP